MENWLYKKVANCRICGNSLQEVFDLGSLCLNAFPKPGEPDTPRVPLVVAYCDDCDGVQLAHTTNPEYMFRDYHYLSATNESMREALREITQSIESRVELLPGDVVLDIGVNDGTMLQTYTKNVTKVGIDPSNIETPDDIIRAHDYFSANTFYSLSKKPAKVVTSIAMFYDIDDYKQFIEDVDRVLDKNGLWVIQIAYLPKMLENNAFDGIVPEHLLFFTLKCVYNLLQQYGFAIEDAEEVAVNEGSIRLYVKRSYEADVPSERYLKLLKSESKQILADLHMFAERINNIRTELLRLLDDYKSRGYVIHGIAASTKSNTLLQYFGIDKQYIDAIWERQPQKWGHETVGTRIPIISEEQGRRLNPDATILLAWHFHDSIIKRESEYLKNGGQIILPLPEVEIVTGV